MPRRPNAIATVVVKVSTTPLAAAYLDELVATGLYGKTQPEAAERLITRSLEALVESGVLKRKDGKALR